MTISPWYFCRRSISAAANPAPPPPTITILFGASGLTRGLASRLSALLAHEDLAVALLDRHESTGLKAGARKASPVRRSKQA